MTRFLRSKNFTAERAWGSELIANMSGITTKLHWTDQPYKWHVNDGEEVFVVLDGSVTMHYKKNGIVKKNLMEVGDIFFASVAQNMWHIPMALLEYSSLKKKAVNKITQPLMIRPRETLSHRILDPQEFKKS